MHYKLFNEHTGIISLLCFYCRACSSCTAPSLNKEEGVQVTQSQVSMMPV